MHSLHRAGGELPPDSGPAALIYRTDANYVRHEPAGGWSASWHRAVIARVAEEVPGLVIVYRP